MVNLHGPYVGGGREKESEKGLHWIVINCSSVKTFNQNNFYII